MNASFEVFLEHGHTVLNVKHGVEKEEGVAAGRQDLLVLSKGSDDDGDSDNGHHCEDPLEDYATVGDGWLLALLVKATEVITVPPERAQWLFFTDIRKSIHSASK